MKITLLRHGQSTYNIRHRLNGDPSIDVPLTPKGRTQARHAHTVLANESFTHLFVSEFPRAQATLELIRPKQPYVIDARLNDIQTGFEGRSVAMWAARLKLRKNAINIRFHDGESIIDVHNRTRSFIKEQLGLLPDDANVLIVSHYLTIQTLIGSIDGISLQKAIKIRVLNATPIIKHLNSATIQSL